MRVGVTIRPTLRSSATRPFCPRAATAQSANTPTYILAAKPQYGHRILVLLSLLTNLIKFYHIIILKYTAVLQVTRCILGAGGPLKELRNRLAITTREVSERSRKIAEGEGVEEFHISNAWLTQIENKQVVPSVHKLYSLSVIYRMKFTDLLRLYGVDLEKISRYQLGTPLDKTHLTTLEVYDEDRAVTFPVHFDRGFRLEKTDLLSRMVQVWGEVPISLIQHLDLRHGLYGYIGLEDWMMYPLLRPGSFVQIDSRQRKVGAPPWRSEFDRPVYFVELRDGYTCSWCDLQGSRLTLLPYPLSPNGIRQFAFPSEAEIVGRVTAAAMRLVNYMDYLAPKPARLPRPPRDPSATKTAPEGVGRKVNPQPKRLCQN